MQELEEDCIGDQEEASLYDNSLLDKQNNGQVDSLDDSLCMDEGTKEEDILVPSMETSTPASPQRSEDSRSEKLIDGEKNCSLVDELFDDLPATSQNTNDSSSGVETQNNNKPEKKITPSFGNEKKKRFRAPVQSVTKDASSKESANDKPKDQPKDKPKDKLQPTSDNPKPKVEKAKPLFSTKPSAGRKRKSPEGGSNDDKIIEPPKKVSKTEVDKQKPDQHSLASEANTEAVENTNSDNTNGNTTVDPAASTDSTTLKETSCASETTKEKKKKSKETGKTKDGTSVKKKKKNVDDKTASKKLASGGEDKSSTGGDDVGESMDKPAGKNLDGKNEVVFKKKKQKTTQQQAQFDISCKNLEKEQHKAEIELKKIDRDLKKARKQHTHKVVKKSTKFQEQSSNSGDSSGQVWVQCDHPNCLKWRRLKDCNNPSDIPDEWYCNMNPGESSSQYIEYL